MADIVLMKNPLGARDSFRQIADQPYEMAWQIGQVGAPARATIAIPTYKRIDTLVEAINSAVAAANCRRGRQRGRTSCRTCAHD